MPEKPSPKALVEILNDRTEAVGEWTKAELIKFIEDHNLPVRGSIESHTKAELVSIIVVTGSLFDLAPVMEAKAAEKERLSRVRPRHRSHGAIAS